MPLTFPEASLTTYWRNVKHFSHVRTIFQNLKESLPEWSRGIPCRHIVNTSTPRQVKSQWKTRGRKEGPVAHILSAWNLCLQLLCRKKTSFADCHRRSFAIPFPKIPKADGRNQDISHKGTKHTKDFFALHVLMCARPSPGFAEMMRFFRMPNLLDEEKK